MGLLHPLRIGKVTLPNNLVLSPMAGYSDLPFRALCRQHGAGLVCTEMVAAMSVEYFGENTLRRMETSPAERPVSVQIVGNDLPAVAHVTPRVSEACDIVGLNMGCPAHQVAKTGCGAALLDRPDLAVALVETIKAHTDKPLLVKMRSGTSRVMDCAAFARRLERAGADGLIFHARTAAQSYRGRSDWALIRDVKAAVGIPVLGNGDVRDGPSAERALAESGCDGLAIGRATLGDPRVFARIASYLETGIEPAPPTPEQRLADFRAYAQGAGGSAIPRAQIVAHAHAFTKGMYGGAQLRARLPHALDAAEALRLFEAHVEGLAARGQAAAEA